jgi:sucrase/ferredoxin-like protein
VTELAVDDVADPMLGCAVVARLLGGNPSGTATYMRSWLLIEHPGPWPPDALEQVLAEAFSPARRELLRELEAAHGLRSLLIRKPGRHLREPHDMAHRAVFVGGGDPGNRWLERLEINDLPELADLDLAAVADGRGGLGQPVADPLFLVCTHGTKDVCCAVLGRPLATTLDANHPGLTWEVSHIGGDRWAGNLLVVPDGYMHGQLDPDGAAQVAKAALGRQVEPNGLRGRTSVRSRWSQHAEITVRQRFHGVRGLDDVLAVHEAPVLGADPDSPAWVVRVRAGQRLFDVTVRHRTAGRPSGESRCSALVAPAVYETESVIPIAG